MSQIEVLQQQIQRLREQSSKPWRTELSRVLDLTPTLEGRRRNSFAREETPEAVDWAVVGGHFRFVNREEQCEELWRAFQALEGVRLKALEMPTGSRWEALKRDVRIPVCTGMPGIGKTRFAREAVAHLSKVRSSTTATSAAPYGDGQLIAAFVGASSSGCNIRIDCSACKLTSSNIDKSIAVVLIAEWAKHRRRGSDSTSIPAALENTDLSLQDAVRFMLDDAGGNAPVVAPGRGGCGSATSVPEGSSPVLLINVDEAHALQAELLGEMLRQLLRLLIVDRLRVFVTVTGVNADVIRNALISSGVGAVDISLPLLTLIHVCDVAKAFMPELNVNRPVLVNTLWWLGGVPRYLAYLFAQAALMALRKGAASVGRTAVATFIDNIDSSQGTTLITQVAKRVLDRSGIEADVLDGALSFALVGQPVSRSLILSGASGAGYTVQRAQEGSLLYWHATPSPGHAADGLGVIDLPPIVLYWRHLTLPTDEQVYLLRYFSPFMSSRDNEGVAVSVLMHKLRALSQLGTTTVHLSALGLPLDACDYEVEVPKRFNVVRTDGNVDSRNFLELVQRVRSNLESPVAYVNGPTASFADAFIILRNFIIFIQEKQRVLARQQMAAGLIVPIANLTNVDVEYAKLGGINLPHAFLFITDENAAAGLALGTKEASRCIVPRAQHEALLGSMFAHLRAATLAPSFIDARGGGDVSASSVRSSKKKV